MCAAGREKKLASYSPRLAPVKRRVDRHRTTASAAEELDKEERGEEAAEEEAASIARVGGKQEICR